MSTKRRGNAGGTSSLKGLTAAGGAGGRTVQTVKVGDVIELSGPNGIVVLPDGSAVSSGARYTVRHIGPHVIDGVKYEAR